MSRTPSSSKHPAINTEASNIYHATAPKLGIGTSSKRANRNISSHGGEIGFDLAFSLLFKDTFLKVRSGDTYVDLGGGRGGTSIICKLVEPGACAVSIEVDKPRHKEGVEWVKRITEWNSMKKPFQLPILHNISFLEDRLDELWKKPRLKIYFNNYEQLFVLDHANTQSRLEEKLSKFCPVDTVIVSFEKMFNCRRGDSALWSCEELETYASSVDVDWFSQGYIHKFKIYKYTRSNNVRTHQRRRKCKVPTSLGLMQVEKTVWEEGYGKQLYPVKIAGTSRDGKNYKVHFMGERPWPYYDPAFEKDTEDYCRSLVHLIYQDGAFNAAAFLGHLAQSWPAVLQEWKGWESEETTEDPRNPMNVLRRWIGVFEEMSHRSFGSSEHLKRTCSYVRPSRHLLSALTLLESSAVCEFGAGKGVLFSLLKMWREARGFDVSHDVAFDSKLQVKQWATFHYPDELKCLQQHDIVRYWKEEECCKDKPSFQDLFETWKGEVDAGIDGNNLTPEMLLLSWPSNEDEVVANCIQGWHDAGGERLAIIYDPYDQEATDGTTSLDTIPGDNWCLLQNVLKDDGAVKDYEKHMPLMPWGASREVYQDANPRKHTYGLYIFSRNNKKKRPNNQPCNDAKNSRHVRARGFVPGIDPRAANPQASSAVSVAVQSPAPAPARSPNLLSPESASTSPRAAIPPPVASAPLQRSNYSNKVVRDPSQEQSPIQRRAKAPKTGKRDDAPDSESETEMDDARIRGYAEMIKKMKFKNRDEEEKYHTAALKLAFGN